MDFAVTEMCDNAVLVEKLNAVMPDGLRVIRIDEPVYANKEIGYAEYNIKFRSEKKAEQMKDLLESMMAMESIEIDKRSKSKGTIKIDPIEFPVGNGYDSTKTKETYLGVGGWVEKTFGAYGRYNRMLSEFAAMVRGEKKNPLPFLE